MTNKLNPTSLKQLIDKVKEKWKNETYIDGTTTAENIRGWIIADVYLEVLRYIGISEYDSEKKHGDMDTRRVAEIVDMVERHWEGGIRLPEYLLKEAIK